MRSTRPLFALAVVVGCSGGYANGPDETTPPASRGEPGSRHAAEPAQVPEGPPATDSPPPDLLRCALDVQAYELGEAGDGAPSTPALLGDAFVVAFTRTTAAGSALLAQRIRFDGVLEPALVLRDGVHGSRPFVAGDGARAYALAVSQDGTTEAIPLDPATGGASGESAVPLPHPPDDVVLGPRGLVATHVEEGRRVLHRHGEPDVALPAPRSFPSIREQILASGPATELVLIRHGRSAGTAAVTGRTATRSPPLFRDTRGSWAEASVAAGPEGFVLVRTGPGIGDLEVYPADRAGTLGARVSIPAPTDGSRPADALVRRYPRAAALREGWALSYWDGTGPSLVRIDAAGRVTADAVELRSDDERGGHTDARMVATDTIIAVSWQVEPPMRGHGFPEEVPRRPGPRAALLRCAR